MLVLSSRARTLMPRLARFDRGRGTVVLPGIEPPFAVQQEYRLALWAVVRNAWAQIDRVVLPAYRAELAARADGLERIDEVSSRMQAAIDQAVSSVRVSVPAEHVQGVVQRAAADTNRRHKKTFYEDASKVVGLNISADEPFEGDLIQRWVQQNVSLITSVPESMKGGLAREIEAAFRAGTRHEVLRDRWIENGVPLEWGTLEGRMRVIARDQVQKLNAQLSEHRQRSLGVKRYTWRTNVDGRERPHHRERNGQAFSWDEPPSGGHPGSEVHCRCTAEAILDLDDLFGAEDVTLTDATGAVVNAGDSEEEAPQVQRAAWRAPVRPRAPRQTRARAASAQAALPGLTATPPASRAVARRAAGARAAEEAAERAAREAAETAARRVAAEQAAAERAAQEAAREAARREAAARAEALRRQARRSEATAFASRHGIRPDIDLDTATMRKVGDQAGSNEGGFFEDPDGVRWYVKTPRNADQARSEVLASKLYELAAAAPVAEVHATELAGRLAVASRIESVRNVGTVIQQVPGAIEGFAVDAWLANWDVVGLGYDNLQQRSDGMALRLDVGGALEFRAQGAKKGRLFGNTVGEIQSLRDATVNPQSAAVFASMTDEQLLASMRRVVAVSDDAIREVVARYGYGSISEKSALARKLIDRKRDIARQAVELERKIAWAQARGSKVTVDRLREHYQPLLARDRYLREHGLRDLEGAKAREAAIVASGSRHAAKIQRAQQIEADLQIDARGRVIPAGPVVSVANESQRRAAMDEWIKTLSEDEIEAIRDWTRGGYVELRAADSGVLAEEQRLNNEGFAEVRLNAAFIRAAMARAPRYEGVVYRGMHLGNEGAAAALYETLTTVGSEYNHEGIASWAWQKAQSDKFARDESRSIVLKVRTTRGVAIDDKRTSDFEERETEVLIDRGFRFRVVSVTNDPESVGGRKLVELEEID